MVNHQDRHMIPTEISSTDTKWAQHITIITQYLPLFDSCWLPCNFYQWQCSFHLCVPHCLPYSETALAYLHPNQTISPCHRHCYLSRLRVFLPVIFYRHLLTILCQCFYCTRFLLTQSCILTPNLIFPYPHQVSLFFYSILIPLQLLSVSFRLSLSCCKCHQRTCEYPTRQMFGVKGTSKVIV